MESAILSKNYITTTIKTKLNTLGEPIRTTEYHHFKQEETVQGKWNDSKSLFMVNERYDLTKYHQGTYY